MHASVRSPAFLLPPQSRAAVPCTQPASPHPDALRIGRPGRSPRSERIQPHHVAAIDSFIDRNIENVVRIDDLAAQVGLSRYHFLRCFKRATGSSPLQYVLARRVEHARRLLAQSDESIAAVAYAAGFSSQSHLNAMFKRHFGVTPGAFVRVHRRPALR